MAEFPHDLYDSELRLPSDFFLDETTARFNGHHLPCMELECEIHRLVRSFTDLGLLQLNPSPSPPKPPPYLRPHTFEQRFRQPVLFNSYDFRPTGYNNVTETEPSFSNLRLLHQYQLLRKLQAQPQRERYLLPSAQALQEQKIRLQQPRPLPPVGESEIRFRSGGVPGLVRVSGGTGVFLPRLNATANKGPSSGVLAGRQGIRNGQDREVEQRNWMKQQQGEGGAEMRLPQDWTY